MAELSHIRRALRLFILDAIMFETSASKPIVGLTLYVYLQCALSLN